MTEQPSRVEGDYFPGLTGLRGIAAGWVALFHLWLLAGSPRVAPLGIDLTALFACGYLGVDLFFVLSGFLLGLPFMAWAQQRRPFPDLRTFWKRRCLRVLPAYWIQLVILVVVAWCVQHAAPIGLSQLLAYLSMEFVFFNVGPLLNDVWWSLPVEWNFYIVLPLLALAFARCRALPVVGLALVLVAAVRWGCYELLLANYWHGAIAYPTIIQLPARVDEFVFGMLAAGLHLRRTTPASSRDTALLVIGLLGVATLLALLAHRGDIFVKVDVPWIFLYATCAGASLTFVVYATAARARLAQWLFAGHTLAFLGTVSYSLYLWHPIVYRLAVHFGLTQWPLLAGFGGLALALLPPCVIAAWISYRLTEHPFLVTAPAQRQDHARDVTSRPENAVR